MATLNIVRQPDEFQFGSDFDLFFDRMQAFMTNVKAEDGSRYSLFLSFLDPVSFRKAQAIVFTNTHKTNDVVDLTKARSVLKTALSKQAEVPPNVQLRYCIQKKDETISDFGYNIQVLGHKAYGTDAETNAQVIEAFCAGLLDQDLTAKMLQKLSTFATLKAAIDYSVLKETSINIKHFIARNRNTVSRSSRAVDVLEVENVSTVLADLSVADAGHGSNQQSHQGRYQSPGAAAGNQSQRPEASANRQQVGDRYSGRNQRQPYGRGRGFTQNTQYRQSYSRGSVARGRETRACYYCGIKGHLVRDCYTKQHQESRTDSTVAVGRGRGAGSYNRQQGFPGRPAQ